MSTHALRIISDWETGAIVFDIIKSFQIVEILSFEKIANIFLISTYAKDSDDMKYSKSTLEAWVDSIAHLLSDSNNRENDEWPKKTNREERMLITNITMDSCKVGFIKTVLT